MTERPARSTTQRSDEDERRQLQRACQDLVREFSGKLPADEVQARFEEIVHQYDDAPVRSFVPVLAGRAARQRLRELASA
ncbi:MAG: three-helix bundle dimerization domain-containing protein [Actinomycetes bacterium]